MYTQSDIIVAPATASGGALGIIRMSGEGAIALCDQIFRGKNSLTTASTHTLHYGTLEVSGEVIDEVVVSLFRAPHSYTGEESVEISCHGSRYIQQRLLAALIDLGARMATPGEFSMRALLGGRLDLSQAEAVADLIASESRAAHTMALDQMRGHYSQHLAQLRDKLLEQSALLELELDFSEEDVAFVERSTLRQHLEKIGQEIQRLEESFRLGNVLRDGVVVAIVGEPNAGKSTLLNRLAGDERALVSEIAGTTRDTIEECIQIEGVIFRLIDTAGLHETSDHLEQLGIERTHSAIRKARIVLQLVDASQPTFTPIAIREEQERLLVYNKCDKLSDAERKQLATTPATLLISAQRGDGIEFLRQTLRQKVDTSALDRGESIVSNARHAEALHLASEALVRCLNAFDADLSSDLLAEELRQVAHHLGTITGTITSDDILKSIFSTFCIGK